MHHTYNLQHYHHPTKGQIERAIKRSKLPTQSFEIANNIPKHTINQVLAGTRRMPPKYWHLFAPKRRKKKEQKPKAKPLTDLAKSRLQRFTSQ